VLGRHGGRIQSAWRSPRSRTSAIHASATRRVRNRGPPSSRADHDQTTWPVSVSNCISVRSLRRAADRTSSSHSGAGGRCQNRRGCSRDATIVDLPSPRVVDGRIIPSVGAIPNQRMRDPTREVRRTARTSSVGCSARLGAEPFREGTFVTRVETTDRIGRTSGWEVSMREQLELVLRMLVVVGPSDEIEGCPLEQSSPRLA
jgi:uncharacterized protein YceK